MTDYPAVLQAIRPGTAWLMNGDEYAGLVWLDDSPKPTKKTLDDAWPAVQQQRDIERVREQRAALYRAETDGMFFEAMRGEGTVTLDDWKLAVDAIKAAHPFPGD